MVWYYFIGNNARKVFANFNNGIELFRKIQTREMKLEQVKTLQNIFKSNLKEMVFVTQTSTDTMVKRVRQEHIFVIVSTLLEKHFLPSSGFVMLMLVEDVLIS